MKIINIAFAFMTLCLGSVWAQVTLPTPTSPNFDNNTGAGDGTWTNAVNWDTDAIPTNTDDAKINDGLTATYDARVSGSAAFGTLTIGSGSTLSYTLDGGSGADFTNGSAIYFADNSQLTLSGFFNSSMDIKVPSGNSGTVEVYGRPRGTVEGAGNLEFVVNSWIQQRWSADNFTGDMTFTSSGGTVYLREFGGWSSGQSLGQGTNTLGDNVYLEYSTGNQMHDNGTLVLVGAGSSNYKMDMRARAETIANLIIDSPTGTGDTIERDLGGTLTVTNTVTFQGTAGTVTIDDTQASPSGSALVTSNMIFTGTGDWTVDGDGIIEVTGTITTTNNANIVNGMAGDWTKDGTAKLTLGGLADSSGSNTVSAGTLSLTNSSETPIFGTLDVGSSGILDLDYTGTGKVFYLYLGGSLAAAGEWGADGSGAANTSTLITGTGRINHKSGVVDNLFYWDGGDTNITADGDLASDGGSGTWNATTQNWDIGYAAHSAWGNTTNDEAVLGGSADYTVTVAEPISLGDLTFTITGDEQEYTISGSTLNFGPGSTISVSDNRAWQTITCGITGSPAVETKDWGAGNQYQGIKFAPSSGTVTLGDVLNPNDSGNTDKAGIAFGGSTEGNKVGNITYAGGDKYAKVYFEGGGWTATNGIKTGVILMSGGTNLLAGLVECDYNNLGISGTAKVMGTFTNYTSSTGNGPVLYSGATIAPGDGVGTITFDWPAGSTTPVGNWDTNPDYPNGDHSFTMMGGSIYEWEVGLESTDTIHMMQGGLFVSNTVTLKVVDAGGKPSEAEGDILPVFTYDPAGDNMTTPDNATLNANINIDFSETSYYGTPSLVNDGAGMIYVAGLYSPPSGTVLIVR